jgi:dimeric dUTPase (all-alpha-NTP-PPase superfamily)
MSRDGRAVEMLRTMAEMQDTHNCHVHPDWRTQGYEYYRAIWVECAELLDHFGWKWWKHQSADVDQVKLEIVDIWHFALSDLLRSNEFRDELADALSFEVPDGSTGDDGAAFRAAVERLAEDTLRERKFLIEPFVEMMKTLPMGFGELFSLYVGKNVLNNFRQDHGYKTGDYRKEWHGREDNEHLVEVLEGLSCDPEEVPEEVYQALRDRYPA